MSDTTRYLQWQIPEPRLKFWYTAFLDLMNAVDADVAARVMAADILEPFVAYGLTTTMNADNRSVRLNTGVAYTKRRRVVLPVAKDFSVTNTGAAHTEYVKVDALDNFVISTTAPTADEVALASVSVNADGTVASVTDQRPVSLRFKVLGTVQMTIGPDYLSIPGKLRIGDSGTPTARVHVVNGDVAIDDSSRGVIYKDSGGTYWRERVGTAGERIMTNLGNSIPP
jgi:hypothetical protein